MKKHIFNFSLALVLLSAIFLIFIPYFTSDFLDLRQKQENEENYQKLLKEQLAEKEELKNYLTGKFDPAQREDFVLIPPEYTSDGSKMYLRKEAYNAYLKMHSSALLDGVELRIESATRNFDYQRDLWSDKWNGVLLVDGDNLATTVPDELERFKRILEYNAVPGASRHHWGTDIDVYRANPPISENDEEDKEERYGWLTENAHLFGFCQTYSKKGAKRETGYNEERWHWSYLPLAKVFTEEYRELVTDEDIEGFEGDEYVAGQNLISNYVLSINPDCI